MWKVARKGLRANFIRFALTAVAVILGVSFMTGTSVLTATIQTVFDDLITNVYKNTDVVVRARSVLQDDFAGDLRPNIPESLVAEVRNAPGVRAAEGTVQVGYAQIVPKDGDEIGRPGQGPPTLGFGVNPDPELNPFNIVEGRPPETDDEVAVDKASADEGDIKVGDTVSILSTDKPKKYTVTGIAKFGTADGPAGASAALFTLAEAQRLGNAKGEVSEISVAGDPGISEEQLRDNIETYLAANGNAQYEVITGTDITKEQQDSFADALSFINIGLTAFALIALVVGAFIIYNTFSIVVAQRTKELALLRAMGASRRQVLTTVIGEAAAVGLVASAIGVVVGIILALGLRALMAAIGFDIPGSGVTIEPQDVITGLVIGVAITVLSAIVPARYAARVPPVAAMRDVQIERPPRKVLRFCIGGGAMLLGVVVMFVALFGNVENAFAIVGIGMVLVFIGAFVLGPLFARWTSEVVGAPIARLKGITGQLARENVARNPKRTATTATALIIGVALVGFITVFAASAKATIADAVDGAFKSDYIITFGAFGPGAGFSPTLAEEVAELPEVEAATGVRAGFMGVEKSTTIVFALDPTTGNQLFNLGTVAGSLEDLGPNDLAVSTKVADDHGWTLGNEVPVTFVNTGRESMRIAYIFEENNFGNNTVNYYMSIQAYEKRFTDQLDLMVFASLKDGVTPEQGRAALTPLLEPFPTATLQDNAEYKSDQLAQIDQFVALLYVLMLLALVTALVGIANTLALSIHERTREIGLLRSVGMSRKQIRSSIRWESVIICLLGTINGLAIGLFFGWSVVKALEEDGFRKFAFAPGQLFIVVVILAAASILAAWFPARRAAKLDVLKAISTE